MLGRVIFVVTLGVVAALLGSFSLLDRLSARAPVAAEPAPAAAAAAPAPPAPAPAEASSMHENLGYCGSNSAPPHI